MHDVFTFRGVTRTGPISQILEKRVCLGEHILAQKPIQHTVTVKYHAKMSKTALKPWALNSHGSPTFRKSLSPRSPWSPTVSGSEELRPSVVSAPTPRLGHQVLQGLVTVGRYDGASERRKATRTATRKRRGSRAG